MLHMLSLFFLAFALSVDGLGVGVMYGIRSVRIPLVSVFIIALCSGLVIYGSMQIGTILLMVMNPYAAKVIGAVILVGIGCWAMFQTLRQRKEQPLAAAVRESGMPPLSDVRMSREKKTIIHIEIKRLGIVIEILKTPLKADIDKSGIISSAEAALLGIALSLDAFGAGIGAALIGFSAWITSLSIAFSAGLFIVIGLKIGLVFSEMTWIRKLSFLPGILLILMGISKLF